MATDMVPMGLGQSLKNLPFKRLTSTGSNVSVTSNNNSRTSVAQQSSRYDSQFYKTKLCMFWQGGRCTRKFCKYAHGEDELKHMPDLRNTAMCRTLLTTGSCPKDDCSFAHDLDELRATDKFYKTTMCCFYRYGTCKLADQCRHAHSRNELRSNSEGMEKRLVSSDSTASPCESRTEISDSNLDDFADMRWERAETMPALGGSMTKHTGSLKNSSSSEEDSDADLDDYGINHAWERGRTMPVPIKRLDGEYQKSFLQLQAGVYTSPPKYGSADHARRPSNTRPCASPYLDCAAGAVPLPCGADASPSGSLMQLPFIPGLMLVPMPMKQNPAEMQEVSTGPFQVSTGPFTPAQMPFQDMNMVREPTSSMQHSQLMQQVWGMMPTPGAAPGVFVRGTPHSPQNMQSQAAYNQMQASVLKAAMPEVYED